MSVHIQNSKIISHSKYKQIYTSNNSLLYPILFYNFYLKINGFMINHPDVGKK
jgi:hypothetical protein